MAIPQIPSGSPPMPSLVRRSPPTAKDPAGPQEHFVKSEPTPVLLQPAVSAPAAGVPTPDPKQLGKTSTAAAEKAVQGAPGGYLATTPEIKARIAGLALKPEDVNCVLYHANCPDGFGARCAAEALLGDKAQYIPVSYDKPMPDLPKDAKVAIVDFSYPRDQLLDLKSRVAGLVVLDHHKKAVDSLGGLDFAVFDMNRAGAGLSWAYFHPDQPEPEMYKYLEDRDLWKFNLDKSHEVSDAIASYPMDFKTWERLDIGELKKEGTTLERYKQILVNQTADQAVMGKIDGYDVPVVNSHPALRSDVGNELLARFPDAKFAAVYYMEGGQRMWSVRSRGDFDVNEIGKDFGGGGHAAASGFKDPAPPQPIILEKPAKE